MKRRLPRLPPWSTWGRRGLARRADFVYSPRYAQEIPGVSADPLRGERILSFLLLEGLLDERRVHAPEPASFHQLRRVHADDYLDSVGRPGALTSIVGLDLPDPLPDRLLASQRLMTGGTLLASRLAIASGGASGGAAGGVAVNLGGGFHHAFAARGERFCIFNDVAAAIAERRAVGFAGPVLIVDLDLHDGDGTRSIFAGDPTVHQLSLHNRTTPGVPASANAVAVELGSEVGDGAYLQALRAHLPPLLATVQPQLAFYLAGTDPAADDEIGDWKLSADGLLERDRYVLSSLRQGERRVPTVVVLAGGYGPRAWRYSARSLAWLLGGRVLEPPTNEELTLTRYRAMARLLDPHELTGEPGGTGEPSRADDWGLTAEDLAAVGGVRARSRFLGYYSPQGLELTLDRAGLFERLRQRGWENPILEVDLDGSDGVDRPGGETLRLFGDRRRRELLIELRARIDRHTVPGLSFLRVEWLLLQDPRAAFTAERPAMPGQQHPGLGMAADVTALMVLACDRLHLDGILLVPAYYHSAIQGKKLLRFLDPEQEGRFHSLAQALANLPLAAATHAVAEGRVRDRTTGEPLRWDPKPMIYPVSDAAKALVESAEYERKRDEAVGRWAFVVA